MVICPSLSFFSSLVALREYLGLIYVFPLYLSWPISVLEIRFSVRLHAMCAAMESKPLPTFLKCVAGGMGGQQTQNYVSTSFEHEKSSGFHSVVCKRSTLRGSPCVIYFKLYSISYCLHILCFQYPADFCIDKCVTFTGSCCGENLRFFCMG